MKNEAKKINFKELEKKFNKIAPFFLFTVITVIVVVVVILSSHFAKKEIEQYSIRNKEVYTYIGGQKFSFKGKITLNRKNNITNLELDGGNFQLSREPLYVEGEETIIFPHNMAVIFPAFSMVTYKINYFTILDNSGTQPQLVGDNLKYTLTNGLIYDGNDIYFFVKETTLTFNDKKVTLSPMSFVACHYKGTLEVFDYAKKESTVYKDVVGDVIAKSDEYELNLSHDTAEFPSGSILLIKNVDKLSNLK